MKKNVPKLLPTHMPIAAIYYGHTTFSSGVPVLANKSSTAQSGCLSLRMLQNVKTLLALFYSFSSYPHPRLRFETTYEGLAVACEMPLFDII